METFGKHKSLSHPSTVRRPSYTWLQITIGITEHFHTRWPRKTPFTPAVFTAASFPIRHEVVSSMAWKIHVTASASSDVSSCVVRGAKTIVRDWSLLLNDTGRGRFRHIDNSRLSVWPVGYMGQKAYSVLTVVITAWMGVYCHINPEFCVFECCSKAQQLWFFSVEMSSLILLLCMGSGTWAQSVTEFIKTCFWHPKNWKNLFLSLLNSWYTSEVTTDRLIVSYYSKDETNFWIVSVFIFLIYK